MYMVVWKKETRREWGRLGLSKLAGPGAKDKQRVNNVT